MNFNSLKTALYAAACIFTACQPLESAENEFIKEGSLIYEEDNEFYFRFFTAELMTRKALEDYVGNFVGGKVTHFFMNPNGQRTSYRTKVSEALWDPLKYDKKFPETNWTRSCRILYERGLDPYEIWTNKCRQIGISPWISLRVNDQHFAGQNLTHPYRARTLDFWRDHPEFRRTRDESDISNFNNYAFDFSHKEVRDYKLALVREFLDNWDVDGINIDWMRTSLNLAPGREEQDAHYLTDFMREVKKLADEFAAKRGHKIGVAVRVPIKPDKSREIGLCADEWAKLGLIDVLIVSQSYPTHFDLRIKEWKEALGDAEKRVAIVAASDHGFSPYPCGELRDPPRARRGDMTVEYSNAWAETAWYKGADALYFYNLMYSPNSWYALIKEGLSKSKTRSSPRRHPVTYIDDDIMTGFIGKEFPDCDIQLPQQTSPDMPCEFKIQLGRAPLKGDISVVVGFEKAKDMENSSFSGLLNGTESKRVKTVFRPRIYGKSEFALCFEFPISAAKDGINVFSIKGTPAKIVWVEMQCNQ